MSNINQDEVLLKLAESCSRIEAKQDAASEKLDKGLMFLENQHLALAAKVDLKANADDVKDLTNNFNELDGKVSWIVGIGSTIAFLFTSLLAYLGIAHH